jgi:WD40 repeat protein
MRNRDDNDCNTESSDLDMPGMANQDSGPYADIHALVAASDGAFFVTGADDSSVHLRRTDPLTMMFADQVHQYGVRSLAIFEKDDKKVVYSGGGDGKIFAWELIPTKLVNSMELRAMSADSAVNALAVSGRWLASGGRDGRLRLRDHQTGNVIHADTGIEIMALAFTPNGRTLIATGVSDRHGAARAWRVSASSLQSHHTIPVADFPAMRSVVALTNTTAVLGSDDGAIREWDLNARNLVEFDQQHAGPVHALTRLSDLAIISGSSDGTVKKWNASSQTLIGQVPIPFTGDVLALAVADSPDSTMIFAAGGNGEFNILRDGHLLDRPFHGHTDEVRAIALNDGGDVVVTGSADKTARLWKANGAPIGVLTEHSDTVSAVALCPDNAKVVTASEDGTIIQWDRFALRQIGKTMSHGAPVWALGVSPDGKFLYSGGNDRRVLKWRTDTQECVQVWPGPARAISSMAIAGNGSMAVLGADDGTIAFWDLGARRSTPGQYRAVDDDQVRSVAINFDGTAVAVGGPDGQITIWDARRREQSRPAIHTGHGDVLKVLLSPDASMIISCGRNGLIERRSLATGELVGSVHPDFTAGTVKAIALMPDGDLIVAGDSRGEINLVRTDKPDKPMDPGRPLHDDDQPHPHLASDEPARLDTVGNSVDVRTLAELIAARQTVTPSAIALLGAYGAGKSSTILQVKNYVHEIVHSPEQNSAFWLRKVAQIRFNAWHYSDKDLWTGLMNQIRYGLRQEAANDPDLGPPTRAVGLVERRAAQRQHEQLTELHKQLEHDVEEATAARPSATNPFALIRSWQHLRSALTTLATHRTQLAGAAEQLGKAEEIDQRSGRTRMWCVVLLLAIVVITLAVVLFGPDWLVGSYRWLWSAAASLTSASATIGTYLTKTARYTKQLLVPITDAVHKVGELTDKAEQKRATLDPSYGVEQALDALDKASGYEPGVVGTAHDHLRDITYSIRQANLYASEDAMTDPSRPESHRALHRRSGPLPARAGGRGAAGGEPVDVDARDLRRGRGRSAVAVPVTGEHARLDDASRGTPPPRLEPAGQGVLRRLHAAAVGKQAVGLPAEPAAGH